MPRKVSHATSRRSVIERTSTRGNAVTVRRVAPIGPYAKNDRG